MLVHGDSLLCPNGVCLIFFLETRYDSNADFLFKKTENEVGTDSNRL